MNDKDFEKLKKSVREAGKIHRGKRKPSRVFEFDPADIKKIRHNLAKS